MLQRTKEQHCLGGQGEMGAAFFLGEGETVIANFEMDEILHTLFLGTETQTDSEMFTTVFLSERRDQPVWLCNFAVLSKKITFCSIVMFLHGGLQLCGGSLHINFKLHHVKIVSVARDEAANYRSTYGSPIPLKVSFQSIYFRIKDSKSLNQNAIKVG